MSKLTRVFVALVGVGCLLAPTAAQARDTNWPCPACATVHK